VKIRKANGVAQYQVWPGWRLLCASNPRAASQEDEYQGGDCLARSDLRSVDQMLKMPLTGQPHDAQRPQAAQGVLTGYTCRQRSNAQCKHLPSRAIHLMMKALEGFSSRNLPRQSRGLCLILNQKHDSRTEQSLRRAQCPLIASSLYPIVHGSPLYFC
jgi:hypothetical protein